MNYILVAAGVFLLFCLALFVRTGYRIMTGRDRVRLPEMEKALDRIRNAPVSAAEARKASEAGRRCVLCPSHELCDHWLEDPKGAPDFCPNMQYVDKLPRA